MVGGQFSTAGPSKMQRNEILKIMHKDRFHGTMRKQHLFA